MILIRNNLSVYLSADEGGSAGEERRARAESLGTDADVTATMGTELQRVGAGGGDVAVKIQIPSLFPTL